ncbi:MAG: NifU family protein [Ilumatobacteraceae bacterium]
MSDEQTILTITAKAYEKVMSLREGEAEGLALWLEVSGVAGGEYAYDLYFQPVEEAEPGDVVQHHDDLPVVIPAASVDSLRGSTLDMARDLLQPGMVLQNPNTPPAAPGPASPAIQAPAAGELTGDVAERVAQVIERQINPAIAAHGGRAELVAVEDEAAYVRLSGGCQGCGMATVTLSQGIERAILDAVPEVTRVLDVTDHAAGESPYFEAAKK